MRSVVFTICLVAGMLSASITMASSPPVPNALKRLVQEFPPLEEAFRRDKWGKAQQRLKGINAHYTTALPDLVAAAKGPKQRNKVSQFGFLLKDLNKQLTARQRDKAERSFHLFGGLIIELIDLFQYDEHPLLVVFAKKCGMMMMKDAAFDKITAEMIEMQSSVKRMRPSLQKRGVAQAKIDASLQQLSSVLKALSGHNKQEVHQQLAQLQQTYREMAAVPRHH